MFTLRSILPLVVGAVALGAASGLAADRGKELAAKPPTTIPTTAPGMKYVGLALPKPVFQGTPPKAPPNTTVDMTYKGRGLWFAPEGASVVSLKKPVTSSDENPVIGTLNLITDGDKEALDGSWVELGPGVQWVQIDLKEPCKIYGILFWHYHGEARVFRDVVVQVSNDKDFIKDVVTIFNNDQDNSAGLGIGSDREYFETNEGKLVDGKSTVGRYVRLYSNGSTNDAQNPYTEVEVWGAAAK